MRISDWSSDVCSSDLDLPALVAILAAESDARGDALAERARDMAADIVRLVIAEVGLDAALEAVGRLGGDEVDQARGRVAAIERALRPFQHLETLKVPALAGVHDRIGLGDHVGKAAARRKG